jgi:hypothetical protein
MPEIQGYVVSIILGLLVGISLVKVRILRSIVSISRDFLDVLHLIKSAEVSDDLKQKLLLKHGFKILPGCLKISAFCIVVFLLFLLLSVWQKDYFLVLDSWTHASLFTLASLIPLWRKGFSEV